MGEAKARANRLANADHANLVRTSRAAHAQLEAVRRLADDGRLDELSPPLREVAELRLEHPSLSLRELALKCRPPATKAAAHRRLAEAGPARRAVIRAGISLANPLVFAPQGAQYSWASGGSVLVRRRIQTPSVAKVRSAVQLEGEVVLGASPPARRFSRPRIRLARRARHDDSRSDSALPATSQ